MLLAEAVELASQAGIIGLGSASIALIAMGRRKLGFLLGLLSEPFWLITAYTHMQWGIILSALWWTCFYALGFYRECKENEQKRKNPS